MSLLARLTGRCGLGWRPDPADDRDFCASRLGLSAGAMLGEEAVPPHYHLLPRSKILQFNQGATESCVAQALADAINIRERIKAGAAFVDPPSRLFIYYHARRFDGQGLVLDYGCTIRGACKGLAHAGAPDELLMPWSTSPVAVNSSPPWKAYMAAYGRRGASYYRILTLREQRGAAVRQALLGGFPVVFGAMVDKAFVRNAGPPIIDALPPSAARIGGHAMCITGYAFDTTRGDWTYEIVNSWGDKWRDGGFASISEGFLCSADVSALTIIDGWQV